MVYTAGSAALAILEMLVHLDAHAVLGSYLLAEATFDDALAEEVDRARLPANWCGDPPPMDLRAIGDGWAAVGNTVALRVPSALVELESNYLLNPAHPDFALIRLGAFQPFDSTPGCSRPGN